MPELTPPLLLTALVITTLATGGLLGLWAATSRWHWFLRAMVVLGVLTPLLWRPIFEPFVTLLVEVTTVVLGIAIYRRSWPRWRFSLSGVLMFTVIVAVVVSALARGAEMDFHLWKAVVGRGVVAGCCTLLAAWLATSLNWNWFGLRGIIICFAVVVVGVGWSMTEYTEVILDVCVRSCRGTVDDYSAFLQGHHANDLIDEGVTQASMLVALIAVPLLLWRLTRSLSEAARAALMGVCLLPVVAWPTVVLGELLTPIPIPQPTAKDNAYEELVALGNRLVDREPRALTDDEMTAIEQCLAGPIELINEYDKEIWVVDENRRDLVMLVAGTIGRRADLSRKNQPSDTTLESILLLFQLARKLEGQGLVNDVEMTANIELMAAVSAYRTLPYLDTDQKQELTRYLIEFLETRPSLAPTLQRQICYEQHATGWAGHLGQYLAQISPCKDYFYYHEVRLGFALRPESDVNHLQTRLLSSLLTTELLLDEYWCAHQEWPATLDELTDRCSPVVWADPFSKSGEDMIYRTDGKGYELGSRREDKKGKIVRARESGFGWQGPPW